jgi:Lrp/AsnC family leucine-responsive transcriptional regulator
MDATDIRLCKLLISNSRAPYRELAERLGMTAQAVHRRIQELQKDKVIRRFTARLSAACLDCVFVGIQGVTGLRSADEVLERLRDNDCVAGVSFAAGNQLFLGAILRRISDLEPFIDVVKNTLLMPEPQVGLLGRMISAGTKPEGTRKLSGLGPLDFRLLNSLHFDARKSVADIAGELKVSVKTVKRHLESLEKGGAIHYSIEWEPAVSSGILGFLMVRLRPKADKTAAMNLLNRTFGDRLLSIMSGGNSPDILLLQAWSPTGAGFLELCDRMSSLECVGRVTSFPVQGMRSFETWRDAILAEKAKRA